MKKVGVRKFRSNLAQYLDNLPLMITRHGKTIAVVYKTEMFKLKEKPKKIKKGDAIGGQMERPLKGFKIR